MSKGWVGVDLDGTLAHYGGWNGGQIGAPIAPMVRRVKKWLAEGQAVKIMTARAYKASDAEIKAIQDWTEKHLGKRLPVTCTKDYHMVAPYDDRAVQVKHNVGTIVGGGNAPE